MMNLAASLLKGMTNPLSPGFSMMEAYNLSSALNTSGRFGLEENFAVAQRTGLSRMDRSNRRMAGG
jgi:hypothetical protein